jgi:hypothetical protein
MVIFCVLSACGPLCNVDDLSILDMTRMRPAVMAEDDWAPLPYDPSLTIPEWRPPAVVAIPGLPKLTVTASNGLSAATALDRVAGDGLETLSIDVSNISNATSVAPHPSTMVKRPSPTTSMAVAATGNGSPNAVSSPVGHTPVPFMAAAPLMLSTARRRATPTSVTMQQVPASIIMPPPPSGSLPTMSSGSRPDADLAAWSTHPPPTLLSGSSSVYLQSPSHAGVIRAHPPSGTVVTPPPTTGVGSPTGVWNNASGANAAAMAAAAWPPRVIPRGPPPPPAPSAHALAGGSSLPSFNPYFQHHVGVTGGRPLRAPVLAAAASIAGPPVLASRLFPSSSSSSGNSSNGVAPPPSGLHRKRSRSVGVDRRRPPPPPPPPPARTPKRQRRSRSRAGDDNVIN